MHSSEPVHLNNFTAVAEASTAFVAASVVCVLHLRVALPASRHRRLIEQASHRTIYVAPSNPLKSVFPTCCTTPQTSASDAHSLIRLCATHCGTQLPQLFVVVLAVVAVLGIH